jgi:hypothetical protein
VRGGMGVDVSVDQDLFVGAVDGVLEDRVVEA